METWRARAGRVRGVAGVLAGRGATLDVIHSNCRMRGRSPPMLRRVERSSAPPIHAELVPEKIRQDFATTSTRACFRACHPRYLLCRGTLSRRGPDPEAFATEVFGQMIFWADAYPPIFLAATIAAHRIDKRPAGKRSNWPLSISPHHARTSSKYLAPDRDEHSHDLRFDPPIRSAPSTNRQTRSAGVLSTEGPLATGGDPISAIPI